MVVLTMLLAIAVGLLAVLVTGLLRAHAEVIRSLHDLGINLDPSRLPVTPSSDTSRPTPQREIGDGAAAFDLLGETPAGDPATIAVRGPGRLTLIVFLSSSCLTCRGFWDAFADADLVVPGGARPVLVTKGTEAESPAVVRGLAPAGVVTLLSSEAWVAYGVPVAPYFVLVNGTAERVVGEGAATTWKQMRNLMEQALADAGIERDRTTGPRTTRWRREPGPVRAARIDESLRAAGIEPGDPSLHPEGPNARW